MLMHWLYSLTININMPQLIVYNQFLLDLLIVSDLKLEE